MSTVEKVGRGLVSALLKMVNAIDEDEGVDIPLKAEPVTDPEKLKELAARLAARWGVRVKESK